MCVDTVLVLVLNIVNFFVGQSIGKFLLDVCGRESELWVVAEAVDTIMDVFGEDETDNAAAHINLVEKLQALLPSLRHKVRVYLQIIWYVAKYTSETAHNHSTLRNSFITFSLKNVYKIAVYSISSHALFLNCIVLIGTWEISFLHHCRFRSL